MNKSSWTRAAAVVITLGALRALTVPMSPPAKVQSDDRVPFRVDDVPLLHGPDPDSTLSVPSLVPQRPSVLSHHEIQASPHLSPNSEQTASSRYVTTGFAAHAEIAKGSALRPRLEAIYDKIMNKHYLEAQRDVDALCAEYEALFDKDKKQYSFASRSELDAFLNGNNKPFEWIDAGYAECLKDGAFLAVERKDYTAGLEKLLEVEAVDPISAGAALELGALQGRLGKYDEALATYQKSRMLASTYASQRPYLAAALRGIGSTSIDLKRLGDAEQAFNESLKIEPGNSIALSELSYIKLKRGI